MTTESSVPVPDRSALHALVHEAKSTSLKLAIDMMSALSPSAQQMLASLQDEAWRIGLEVTADVYGTPRICLIVVSSTGERRPVITVAESAAAGSH